MIAKVLPIACAIALAACQSAKDAGPLPEPKGAARTPGVEAVLIPKNGSAAQGDVKIMQRGDRLAVLVSLHNVMAGPYRVVFHERGNCSSPNAFSAGRAWVPPGDARSPTTLLPVLAVAAQGHGQMTAQVSGVRLQGPDSLEGRSVVVYQGANVDANLKPDVPNDVVLCGAIGPIRSFMEAFQ